MTQDDIPIVEKYRGVGVHDFQTRERIDTVVRPAIAAVFGISAPELLFAYLQAAGKPARGAAVRLGETDGARRGSAVRPSSGELRPRRGAGLVRRLGDGPLVGPRRVPLAVGPGGRLPASATAGASAAAPGRPGRALMAAAAPSRFRRRLSRSRPPTRSSSRRPRAVPRAASIAGQRRRKCPFFAR